MGLFIGASILTVLELFDYAYEVIVGGPSGWGHRRCRVPACQTTHHPTSVSGH